MQSETTFPVGSNWHWDIERHGLWTWYFCAIPPPDSPLWVYEIYVNAPTELRAIKKAFNKFTIWREAMEKR